MYWLIVTMEIASGAYRLAIAVIILYVLVQLFNWWAARVSRGVVLDPQWNVPFRQYQWFDPSLTRSHREAWMREHLALEAQRALPAVLSETLDVGRVHFEPGEPQRLADYTSQPQITEYLEAALAGLAPGRYRLWPQLFVGPAGLGKTVLAKVLAGEIRRRLLADGKREPQFVETIGSGISDGKALDAIVRQASAREGSVLFIDEIHALKWNEFGERLYPLLTDQRYRFLGDARFTDLPDFTVIGATTEPGLLADPLLRRFEIHQLRPLEPPEITDIVRSRPFAIDEPAAVAIVERTHFIGAPWDALKVRHRAETFARAAGRRRIELADVQRVFDLEGIDAYGMRDEHRAVIRALLDSPRRGPKPHRGEPATTFHAMSETNLIATARVDPKQFRTRIRPWLMSAGMLYVQGHFGQTLTDYAERIYGGAV